MLINNYILFTALGNSDKKNRVHYFPKSRLIMGDSRCKDQGTIIQVSMKKMPDHNQHPGTLKL